jgi:hypothetical protein
MGQLRNIDTQSTSTGVINLEKPWRVIPDETSTISAGNYMDRFVAYGNSLSAREHVVASPTHVASAGVQSYGGCHDLIIVSNKFHEIRKPVASYCMGSSEFDETKNTLSPNYFTYVADNVFTSCRYGISSSIYCEHSNYPITGGEADAGIVGHVFRNNFLEDIYSVALSASASFDSGNLLMQVCDKSRVVNSPNPVMAGKGTLNQIYTGNSFSGSGTGFTLEGGAPALQRNTWTGFVQNYGGDLPGPILELPNRFADLESGSSITISIWNSGTARLDWRASSDSNWLEIMTPTDFVPDENSEGSLILNLVSPAPEIGSEAIITVTDGGQQSKKITVVYEGEGQVSLHNTSEYALTGLEGKSLKAEVVQFSNKQIVRSLYPAAGVVPFILTVSHEGLSVSEMYLLRLYEDNGSGWTRISFPGYSEGRDPILPIRE